VGGVAKSAMVLSLSLSVFRTLGAVTPLGAAPWELGS
jgi:hypothetical protein